MCLIDLTKNWLNTHVNSKKKTTYVGPDGGQLAEKEKQGRGYGVLESAGEDKSSEVRPGGNVPVESDVPEEGQAATTGAPNT